MATLIKGITANNENVQSKDDAREQHANMKAISASYSDNGYLVFAEYEEGLTATANGAAILVNNFFAMIQGRLCKLEAPTSVDAILGGTGYINLVLDLNAPVNEQLYLEATTSNTPIQNDCLNDGTKFEAPLFSYTSTATSVGTVTPIAGVSVGGDFVEKLNVINPQVVQGALTVSGAGTILNLVGSGANKQISYKNLDGITVGNVRFGENANGTITLANYVGVSGDVITNLVASAGVLTLNGNELLFVKDAFTQTIADGRYLRLSSGTLTNRLNIQDTTGVILKPETDLTTLQPIVTQWTNGNVRFDIKDQTDGTILIEAFDKNTNRVNGIRIDADRILHYGNNRSLAYTDEVILTTGASEKSGYITFKDNDAPLRIVNRTNSTATSFGQVLDLSGNTRGELNYTGSGTGGSLYYLLRATNGNIVGGMRWTGDDVRRYLADGTSKRMLDTDDLAGVIRTNIGTLEAQINDFETLDSTKGFAKNMRMQLEQLQTQLAELESGE